MSLPSVPARLVTTLRLVPRRIAVFGDGQPTLDAALQDLQTRATCYAGDLDGLAEFATLSTEHPSDLDRQLHPWGRKSSKNLVSDMVGP